MGTIHCSVFPLFIFGQFSLDLCFGIRKLHQVHFVFLLIVHGYQSLLYYFSFSFDLVFLLIFFGLVICFHYWFRDLLRELLKKYEILLMVLFLGFFLFLASEALLFVSFFWASFHSL